MRRNNQNAHRVGRPRKPVVRGVSPHIKALDELIELSGRSLSSIQKEAGVGQDAVRDWLSYGTCPRICNFEAVLNVLGWRLEVVPLHSNRMAPSSYGTAAREMARLESED